MVPPMGRSSNSRKMEPFYRYRVRLVCSLDRQAIPGKLEALYVAQLD